MMLTVVIPCYNHGQYIQEAIDSVLTYQDQPVEIIIVDDGSTDLYTINKMEELKVLNYQIIQQKNAGLATARNVGIAKARGKYILPLDADNKIKADYIKKAIQLLDTNSYDIVYAKPSFFGEVTIDRKFKPIEFNGSDLIFHNYIDACAVFRKNVWLKNKGYDDKMPYQGVEDWDFWLNSYFNGFKFHFIDEELYEYRILSDSMITQINSEDKNNATINYLMSKRGNQILSELASHYSKSKMYSNDIQHPFRSIFKYLYRSLNIFNYYK
ncbi:hypothetical protein GCM10022246_07750 [Pedobacter ginsengiterrae]|uniref:Glycosyltransferase 2-like domain-containing protein n=1 Tax=Pedobacter ginsengiterrae TaxID=871696 RepID=A0ABP7P050_9SPHI